jgi:hypothetical protein
VVPVTRRLATLLTLVLVTSLVAPAATAATTVSADEQCSNMVVHDDFRFDDETVRNAANNSSSSTVSNTKVTVEQATGFVRVTAKNPNGYCNEVHVRIATEIVSPAELGSVSATDRNISADWHAVRDFEREETYTEVVVTLGAAEQATFAPSEVRIKTLAWTGTAKSASDGLLGNLSNYNPLADDSDLDKRTYIYSPESNNSTRYITISLANDSTGKQVEEWQAVYRTSDGGDWRPIPTEADAPVFYREVDNGENLQFIFNDKTAEVRWTANPTRTERAKYEWTEYRAGIDILSDFKMSEILMTKPPTVGGIEA